MIFRRTKRVRPVCSRCDQTATGYEIVGPGVRLYLCPDHAGPTRTRSAR